AEQPGHIRSAAVAWGKSVSELADSEDRRALQRARRAAGLAAIGRAAYAALVEELREKDGAPGSRVHRMRLSEAVEQYREDALALRIVELLQDAPELPGFFVKVLEETQQWLETRQNPKVLLEVYA